MIISIPIIVLLFLASVSDTVLNYLNTYSKVPLTQEQTKKAVSGMIILSLILIVFTCPDKELTKEDVIKDKIEKCGFQLKHSVQNQMLDPDAFKLMNKQYVIKNPARGSYIMTLYFTSTNAFGGRVPGMISAEMDLDCNVLNIIDQQGF